MLFLIIIDLKAGLLFLFLLKLGVYSIKISKFGGLKKFENE